jgi:glucose/arabinose dehydrogenase
MKRLRIPIWPAVLLLAACTTSTTTTTSTASATTPAVTSPPGSSPSQPSGGTIVEKMVATDLDHPATFVIDDTGAIFYGERLTGEIRRIDPKTGKNTSVFTIPDVIGNVTNEQGLVGLTIPPSFPQQPYLYAYATGMQLVLTVQKAGIRHNGGRLLFGPDGMLYVVVGETEQSQLAQDKSVNSGKVLRVTPSGGVPKDNPFKGSLIYSYGHRNSFGLAFDPKTHDLWETENGPECNDELNRIIRARNYGWGPSENCQGEAPQDTNGDGSRPVLPQLFYPQTIGPTGIDFCDGCHLGTQREGDLFFGAFNTGDIHEVSLNTAHTEAVQDSTPFNHGNLVLSIETGPDGSLYFSDGVGIFKLELKPS